MRQSLDSSRAPILDTTRRAAASPTSNRYSTYSATPSMTQTERSYPPSALVSPISTRAAPSAFDSDLPRELRVYSSSLARLESKRLQEQRYTVSPEKLERMQNIALTAKVQRGLDRRFFDQDASMKRHSVLGLVEEKSGASSRKNS